MAGNFTEELVRVAAPFYAANEEIGSGQVVVSKEDIKARYEAEEVIRYRSEIEEAEKQKQLQEAKERDLQKSNG